MQEINLDALEPGMTLGQDAVHRNGRLLVVAGTRLTERHLRVLKAWGVYSAVIEEPGTQIPTTMEGITSGSPDRDAAVAAQFAHTDQSHPVTAELFRYRLLRSR